MKLSLLFSLIALVGCSGTSFSPIPNGPDQPEASTPPWATAPSATVVPVQFPEASVPDAADASDGYVCGWECLPAAALLVNTCTGAVQQDCTIIKDHCDFQSSWCNQPSCQAVDPTTGLMVNYPCVPPNLWTWVDPLDNTTHTCDTTICPVGSPCLINFAGAATPVGGVCH